MPAQISVLPTRNPINPAVDVAFSVPATGQTPHDGAGPPALGGSSAENEDASFSLWGSDGFTFGDVFDIINPLQHIPIISTIYRSITGDDIAAGPKVAGGVLFGGVIGLAVSIVDTVIEQITGQDTGEHILAFLKDVEISDEVLVADDDDGFAPDPIEVVEAATIIEMDREMSDALIFATPPLALANGNLVPIEIRRLATPGNGGRAITSANASPAAGEIEPARGRTVVGGAMTAAKAASLPGATKPGPVAALASAKTNTPAKKIPDNALELLATLAKTGVPLNDPRVMAAIPGLPKAMPGVAAAGQSPFAVTNPALWLDPLAESAGKRKDGNRAGADRGVVRAMERALDQYNRSSRLGAAAPRVKVNF